VTAATVAAGNEVGHRRRIADVGLLDGDPAVLSRRKNSSILQRNRIEVDDPAGLVETGDRMGGQNRNDRLALRGRDVSRT